MTRLIAVFLLVFGLVIAGVAISRIDREDPADGAAQQLAEQESTLSLLALPLLAGLSACRREWCCSESGWGDGAIPAPIPSPATPSSIQGRTTR